MRKRTQSPILITLLFGILDVLGRCLFRLLAIAGLMFPVRSKIYLFFNDRRSTEWKLVQARSQFLAERLHQQRLKDSRTRCYWFHVASAGELEQIIPLVRDLGSSRALIVLLSYSSPSAKPFLEKLPFQENLLSFALPMFDRSRLREVLRTFNPNGLFFVRYDLWPALLFSALNQAVPLYLVAATRQFVRKGLFGWPGRWTKIWLLRNFNQIFAISAEDQSYFEHALGHKRVLLAGEPKWARAKERAEAPLNLLSPASTLRERLLPDRTLGRSPILIFGSPHREEFSILQNLLGAHNEAKGLTIIVAPHDVGESEIRRLELSLAKPGCRLLKLSTVHLEGTRTALRQDKDMDDPRRVSPSPFLKSPFYPSDTSGGSCSTDEHRIWIVDVMGSLAEIYGLADLAIIGGGFDGSLHNCLEPAAQGLPVVFGCRHERAPEAQNLLDHGAAMCFSAPEEMFQFLRTCVSVSFDESVSKHPSELLAQMALQSAELFKRVPNTSRVIQEFLDSTSELECFAKLRGPFP